MEKKYPFVISLFVLVLFVTFLFLNDNLSPGFSASDLVKTSYGTSSSPTKPVLQTPALILEDDALPNETTISDDLSLNWKLCDVKYGVDYIPCLDNAKAIKMLTSRRHMEHRERHCPETNPRCLSPLPRDYKIHVPWPQSRDMVWFDNVPHPKLVEYKKDQNWVNKSGDYLIFPGGGTQFKDGVTHYIEFVEKTLPEIEWGKHTRVVLDVGCGVASFGGFLLDKDVLTMSFAPKDEHEAQIQFALERGIPATLAVIGTQRLTFPDNAFDLIHCARCRVHWDGDGGKPLIELNRILRPGGFFVWSATPVYRDNDRDQKVWKAMVNLTESMCWKVVGKNVDSSGIGMVMYQKPVSSSCYENRKEDNPPICDPNKREKTSWYAPLDGCLTPLPTEAEPGSNWPNPWPERLNSKPQSLQVKQDGFDDDTSRWSGIVYDMYLDNLGINWSSVRNVIDMKASYGGFAAALVKQPLWVMNVVPVDEEDTLSVIFDRGLIGIYHDWCESLSTYPRTYDLLHSSLLFKKLTQRCDIIGVAAEMDRILRPGGVVLIHDEIEILSKLTPIFNSLHWSTKLYHQKYLVCKKGLWRPENR